MNNNLLHHIREHSENAFFIDLIQHELDWRLYCYGDHFRNKGKRSLIDASIVSCLIKGILCFFMSTLRRNQSLNNSSVKVLNLVPFSMDGIITSMGYKSFSLPIHARYSSSNVIFSWKLFIYHFRYEYIVRCHPFNRLISNDIAFLKEYYSALKGYVKGNNFKYLFVRTDQHFLERSLLRIFDEEGKKSFLFLHGLPAEYNTFEDVLSTYVIVWGDKIKNNFIRNGLPSHKYHVIGNVKYHQPLQLKKIKWDDKSILVVPESSMQGHLYSDPPKLVDRNRVLIYLYEVEYILKMEGYKHVAYRPHPSFNPKWIQQFVDTNFYTIDTAPLSESANKCTLVIGATSSVILEYCLMGVNCIIYERNERELYPPFDGSDKRIPFASSPTELKALLGKQATVSTDFINDYIKPFDRIGLKKLMEK